MDVCVRVALSDSKKFAQHVDMMHACVEDVSQPCPEGAAASARSTHAARDKRKRITMCRLVRNLARQHVFSAAVASAYAELPEAAIAWCSDRCS